MAYEVICISSDDGADAFSTATEVAEKLGWRLVDEDIVSRAAVEAGVERDVVADVERRKSLVERLLDNLSTSGASMAYVPSLAESLSGPRDDVLRGLIRSIIEEVAAQGNAVIVAHAASLALAERERGPAGDDHGVAGDTRAPHRGHARRRREGGDPHA